MSNNMPYPNGSNSHNNAGLGDPSSSMKDWQDGLRALFPNVNISMGNGGVGSNNGSSNPGSAVNSRLGAFPPGLSGLGNGHQHHHQQQQQQQPQHHLHHHLHSQAHPPMGQPSMHGLGVGKNWTRSPNDWTSIDPAIVSSGQMTDSRSDSPPHWLRSLEQLTETGNSPAAAHPPLSANSSSNLFGLANSTHYNLPSLASRGGGSSSSSSSSNTPGPLDGGMNFMGSFWPPSVSHTTPSMPPPGFSHIRPKTAATAEAHKLDSKWSPILSLTI